MFLTTAKRIIKAGFTNFWRNGFVSLSSVLAMTVALFVIGSVIFASVAMKSLLNNLRSKADFNVYMIATASEKDILSLKSQIEKLPEVAKVDYTSKEQVLEDFKKRHADDEYFTQALNIIGENPLRAHLTIQAKDISQYDAIAKFLSGEDGAAISASESSVIDKIDYFETKKRAIDQLSKIILIGDRVGFAVVILLIAISVIITFNTIRLVTFISKDEIAVMTLVGASHRYVRWPFVVSGMLYGITSAIITLALFYILSFWIENATGALFTGIMPFQYYVSRLPEVILLLGVTGILLGSVGSYFAVRRYLKV